MANVAQELKRLRVERDLTMRELSEKSGISTKTIVAVESGKQKPTALTLARLAKGLGIPAYQLLGVNNLPKDPSPWSQGQPEEPPFPTEDPGPGARWERYGIGYIRIFEGMSDEDLTDLRDKANEELQRRSHA
jgi:transcriptional regulator with XRE-family HTH domain